MDTIRLLLRIYVIVIIARIAMEWIRVSYDHPVAKLRSVLRRLTEPVLAPVRRLLPPVKMGGAALDLSPIVVIIGLGIIANAI